MKDCTATVRLGPDPTDKAGLEPCATEVLLPTLLPKFARFDHELVPVTLERAAREISRYSRQVEPRIEQQSLDVCGVKVRELEIEHACPHQRSFCREFLGANHRVQPLLNRVVVAELRAHNKSAVCQRPCFAPTPDAGICPGIRRHELERRMKHVQSELAARFQVGVYAAQGGELIVSRDVVKKCAEGNDDERVLFVECEGAHVT